MTPFQLILVPVLALIALRSVRQFFRKPASRVVYLARAAISFAAAAAFIDPDVSTRLAQLLGIGRGADLVLYLTTVSFLWASFYFYQKSRRLESDITSLVRHLALERAERDASNALRTNGESA